MYLILHFVICVWFLLDRRRRQAKYARTIAGAVLPAAIPIPVTRTVVVVTGSVTATSTQGQTPYHSRYHLPRPNQGHLSTWIFGCYN